MSSSHRGHPCSLPATKTMPCKPNTPAYIREAQLQIQKLTFQLSEGKKKKVCFLQYFYTACLLCLHVPYTSISSGRIWSPSCCFWGIKAYLILQRSMQSLMCSGEGGDVVLYKYTHLLPGYFC